MLLFWGVRGELSPFRSPLNRGVAGAMDLEQRFTTAFNSIREAKREDHYREVDAHSNGNRSQGDDVGAMVFVVGGRARVQCS